MDLCLLPEVAKQFTLKSVRIGRTGHRARIFYPVHKHEGIFQEVIDDLCLGQNTTDSNVNRLANAGDGETTHNRQPRRYAARETNADIDRHGVADLADLYLRPRTR